MSSIDRFSLILDAESLFPVKLKTLERPTGVLKNSLLVNKVCMLNVLPKLEVYSDYYNRRRSLLETFNLNEKNLYQYTTSSPLTFVVNYTLSLKGRVFEGGRLEQTYHIDNLNDITTKALSKSPNPPDANHKYSEHFFQLTLDTMQFPANFFTLSFKSVLDIHHGHNALRHQFDHEIIPQLNSYLIYPISTRARGEDHRTVSLRNWTFGLRVSNFSRVLCTSTDSEKEESACKRSRLLPR